jgi:hypothetical protein
MQKKKDKLDIIDKILDACYRYNSDALFILSLMHQYEERGSLSRKQLQGLYAKASKIKDMPVNWLATLEATIQKMSVRDKTPVTENTPVFLNQNSIATTIDEILQKYPQHKRVLFLQAKMKNKEAISTAEIAEIEKFKKLLIR